MPLTRTTEPTQAVRPRSLRQPETTGQKEGVAEGAAARSRDQLLSASRLIQRDQSVIGDQDLGLVPDLLRLEIESE